MDYIPNTDGLMRSTLRDSIRRLHRVRARAGAKDEQENQDTSGDPFQDLTNAFIRSATRTKNNINERNEGCRANGQDRMAIEQSNEIRKDLRLMEGTLEEIKKLVDEAEHRLAKENKKKKPKASKVQLLERNYEGRRAQCNDCVTTLQNLKDMDAQRIEVGNKQINMVQEMQLGKRAQLRQQLLGMRRKDNGNGETVGPGDVELVDNTTGGGRLQDSEETKEQMKTIAAQDAKIDAGLDRLKEGVGRLHDLAVQIGAQIDMQNEMLEKTEQTIDKQTQQLRNINKRLNKFLKETRPMNCFLYVCCVFLIIALVGFFLVQFNVI
ncbi:Qb-SNARE protein [Novymonas esmeraldas]|uniref:Qb-SNARE protein n=1 Tax=Novymonas esmeraldas TaxID=1808958 RepID=A0AAW0F0M2_9TRYP